MDDGHLAGWVLGSQFASDLYTSSASSNDEDVSGISSCIAPVYKR